jgi:hypothetical protein
MSEPIPWSGWLRTAALLGVAPHNFWRLSLREWRALISENALDALSRPQFEALAKEFPDTEDWSHDG